MKQIVPRADAEILRRIEAIEREVGNLKVSILRTLGPRSGSNIRLRGILKGVDVTEQDIISAKKSLYDQIEP